MQFVFINGLRQQFTTLELLRIFTRKESITALLIWGVTIFAIHPFEPEGGYAMELRLMLWGSLLPLLFGLYLLGMICAGYLLPVAYSAIAHLFSALCAGALLPLAQSTLTGVPAETVFDPRVFLFSLTTSILLEVVMATYLTYDDSLRQERRARAEVEAQLTTSQPKPLSPEPAGGLPAASAGSPPAQEGLVALLGRPVRLSELLAISAEEHYVRIQTTQGSELLRGRISDLEAQLPPELGMRIHRSHWVATAAVTRLHRKRDNWSLELRDGTEVPVARPRRDNVRDWLAKARIPM